MNFIKTLNSGTRTTNCQLNICSLNIQGLMKHKDNVLFHRYCKQLEIIALYETWQKSADDFNNFMYGCTNFDSMRKQTRAAHRGSAGVSVFVNDSMMQTSGVTRIFHNFEECVVFLFNANMFFRKEHLIMIFTFVAP